jgi:hypothetical protein
MAPRAEWVGLAGANGADRFELWNKVRGTDQQRAQVAVRTEPFDVAEELLAHVERDGRVETGHAAYAVYAYRGGEKAPSGSEATEAERRTKASAFAGEQLKLLLPVILAKIAGVPVDAAAIGGAAAGQLLDSLTDAQKAIILGALRPEQKIALCEMFQARAQKDPTATKNVAPAPPPTTTTGDVSGSSPVQTPSPTLPPQAPSSASSAISASAAASPAASPGVSFTPEEERDLERFTQWRTSASRSIRARTSKTSRRRGTARTRSSSLIRSTWTSAPPSSSSLRSCIRSISL